MTKEQAKKWLPEISHWANGGGLWFYNIHNEWQKKTLDEFRINQIYVIEDQHFEARKAHALGKHIESKLTNSVGLFSNDLCPTWSEYNSYRPKFNEE